jgi:hypothetical protein
MHGQKNIKICNELPIKTELSQAKLIQVLTIFYCPLCVIFQTWTSECEEVLWRSIVLLYNVLINTSFIYDEVGLWEGTVLLNAFVVVIKCVGSVSYDSSTRLITRLLY